MPALHYLLLSITYLFIRVFHSSLENPMYLFGQSAFHLLQDHHQVCADRVGIIGLSFGVYLALRTASQPSVDVCLSLSSVDICAA